MRRVAAVWIDSNRFFKVCTIFYKVVMKYVLFITMLLLAACDGRSAPAPKIAAPQREALEKARDVEQTLQKASESQQKNIGDAEGK